MKSKIPILIPIKEHSKRCHKKNYSLLPYTANYLLNLGLNEMACVITDSEVLKEQALKLKLTSHLEIRTSHQDELTSCLNYALCKNLNAFFLCPVTQPFRSNNLICRMLEIFEEESQEWDFLTTVSTVQDRRQYFTYNIGNNYFFIDESQNRKGSNCRTVNMIDGALYLIKTSFLKTVIKAKDPNQFFWNGKFTCIENEVPFMDIDTECDLQKFEFLREYFTSTNKNFGNNNNSYL